MLNSSSSSFGRTDDPGSLDGLPRVFHDLYYYLYTNSNLPRVERLGAEMVRIIFCKISDELENTRERKFRTFPGEPDELIARRIKSLFERTKERYPEVFDGSDRLHLDDRSIAFVVRKLERHSLRGTPRDVVGEAFQGFLGPGLRGEKGQFFTPRNVAKFCVDALEPGPSERIVDPACGSGGFLIECVSRRGSRLANVYGVDKEIDLARICRAYMAIIGGADLANIYCNDSLDVSSWSPGAVGRIREASFDVVLTNPPFGSRIPVQDPKVLARYELGHEWVKEESTATESWKVAGARLAEGRDPQVLFLERCLGLLRPGGRMAIVLPDGLLGNPGEAYILSFLSKRTRILGVVSLDHVTFMPGTHTKTSVLILQKKKKSILQKYDGDYKVFMAIAKSVGHDKNGKQTFRMDPSTAKYVLDSEGNKIVDDELPQISRRFRDLRAGRPLARRERLGFMVNFSEVRRNGWVLVPSYYDPEVKERVRGLRDSTDLDARSIGELVREGLISIRRGDEIGSRYYGTGDVPFVRTSDLANWEIRADPVKCVPEAIYEAYRKKQDIREGDILFVSDGTFLIGRAAFVSANDTRIVIQSHIRSIRCLRPEKLHPYLLLYLLHAKVVQEQIASKTFVQATISTLGRRLSEIVLPIPKDRKKRREIIRAVTEIMELKSKARARMDSLLFTDVSI